MMPEKIQAARLRLVRERPYLAAAAWALVPVERPGLGTLAVDRWWRIYYDPAAIERWSIEQLAAVLYHELCHLLRTHHARLEAWDPAIANLAGDAEINDDLREDGCQLPAGAIYPETFGWEAGKLAEEYAASLAANQQQGQQSASGQGESAAEGGGDADNPTPSAAGDAVASKGGGADGSSPSATSPNSTASSSGPGDPVNNGRAAGAEPAAGAARGQTPVPAPAAGRCGSCAHGHQEPWEEGPPGESEVPGIGAGEADVIRRHVAAEIIRVAQESANCGAVPGHWRRWAEEKLRPKVDWRRELATAVRRAISATAGAVDYTYRRPSRRSTAAEGVVLPLLHRPVPEVAIIVDTSGSVSDAQLAAAVF